jgi:hypothetical protein
MNIETRVCISKSVLAKRKDEKHSGLLCLWHGVVTQVVTNLSETSYYNWSGVSLYIAPLCSLIFTTSIVLAYVCKTWRHEL